ncbi:hypothetical protein KEM48_000375 [Puccinia striiformis f. sp. tritici PST-130]|nr:hypothetical protein KEM48_000375 [Puccinia striiformis f. sp. tritici PST-130]
MHSSVLFSTPLISPALKCSPSKTTPRNNSHSFYRDDHHPFPTLVNAQFAIMLIKRRKVGGFLAMDQPHAATVLEPTNAACRPAHQHIRFTSGALYTGKKCTRCYHWAPGQTYKVYCPNDVENKVKITVCPDADCDKGV